MVSPFFDSAGVMVIPGKGSSITSMILSAKAHEAGSAE
ncbi:hypothetical protein SAMN04488540_103203 [Ferrimonas sediminum]|uniref:Uncharacterized protein n=1 Tax=Ferrimonas sediminum TaxID=718193 RepID=A0A1G8NQZ9_9GAMM|nr:hypothetical protein SAMN04488540_103203 [Ferrimonas sediminum]